MQVRYQAALRPDEGKIIAEPVDFDHGFRALAEQAATVRAIVLS